MDARINNAEDYLSKLHDYKKAEKLFREIANDAGGDWRSWWGIVKSVTYNFERNFVNDSIETMNRFFSNTAEFVQNAAKVAPAEMEEQLRSTWKAYQQRCWWGMVKSLTHNFELSFANDSIETMNQFFSNTVEFVQNAAKVAPAEMEEQLRSTWKAYQQRCWWGDGKVSYS